MKIIGKILLGFLALFVILNILIVVTGKSYLYKGIYNTYLKGRSGPTIDEYQIFESRTITAGNPQPWPVSSFYNQWKMNDSIEDRMLHYESVSFLVISHDSLLYEKYWEYYTPSTISNSFSMAKTIASILTGIAIKEGHIESVDQPVGDFLPEFREGARSKITIKHLLTMSSGINFSESYSSPFAYPAEAYYGKNLRKLTLSYEPVSEPGNQLDYQSGTTQLLGFVLAEATGTTLSDYASEKLWTPIGAENDALWNLDQEDGVEKTYCCFIATTRDFARLGKLYNDHGYWNGKALVDSEYVAESLKPADLAEKNGAIQTRYGYSWWLMIYKDMPVFYARGVLGQYIWVIPDRDLIVVRLGRKREANQGDNHPVDMFVYLDEAIKIQNDAQ